MKYLTYSSITTSSICFYVSFYHLWLFLRRRSEKTNLYFSLLSLTVATYTALDPFFYAAQTIEENLIYLRLQYALAQLMGIFITAFTFEFLDIHKKIIRTAIYSIFLFIIVCTFIDSELTYSPSKSYLVKKIIFNIPLTYYDCNYGIIIEIFIYFHVICMINMLVLLVRDYIKTRRKEIVPIIVGFVVFFISMTIDLVASDEFIYTLGYAFFALIICMAYSLARRFVILHETVSRIKDELYDLNKSLECKVEERTQDLSATLKELGTTNDALIDARDALWSEMAIAKKIQTVLLPKEPQLPGFEISCYMQPADEVGGDYYDVITVAGKNWVIIGDVSGHGVPAGLVMMMAQSCIRTLVMEYPDIKPSELLRIVNNSIAYNIKNLKEEKFMTITAFAFDSNGKAIFSGRHEDILIYRKNGTVDIMKTDGICISKFPLGKNNKNFELQLDEGEALLLYTDGITEAFDGNNEMFSVKRLVSIFEKTGNLSAREILENIKDNVKDYNIHDDVTLVILKKI